MRAKHTFSTIFWLQSTRAINGQALIYIRITVDGKRANLSSKKRIPIHLWCPTKKKAKGNTALARQINLYLEEVNSKLFQIYQDLKFKEEYITAKLIKSYYTGENNNNGKTLVDIIEYHRLKIENTLTQGTIKNFKVTESYVKKFLEIKKNTTDIYLTKLNYEFLTDFQMYLNELWPVGHPNSLSHNTVMKHIQRLRKIVTLAYHLEWIDKDPFIRWRTTFNKTNRQFLSETELYKLEEKDFALDRLDRVRDLFVFSCYTGISYVDIMTLTPEHLILGIDGGNWIITKRQKTKTVVKMPLLPKALEIIQKYKSHPITTVTESLLPLITNQKLNSFLKEVADHTGINKNLTFHMARHTFATTVALSNGMPIETVSKILGHTKIATTQIYARVLENKVSEDMNTLRTVLQNKRRLQEEERDKLNNINKIQYTYNYI